MAMSKQDILEYLKSATILELNELVKAIEAEFGISAAAPVAVAAAGGAVAAAPVADEGPSTVSVVLAAAGDNKIQVIKVIREITGLGLKEAKDLVDGAPKPVKEGIEPAEAQKLKEKLEAVGAKIEVK